jgi:hypothetical protein
VIVAFAGPSLVLEKAPRIVRVMPPARQGDVWRALDQGATAIALIDGVFEHQPSVWHHEILDALAEGVPVFGGASMGALRAAELHRFGMVGVGQIFRWYASGEIIDDADVALLHADAEHGFRPLTVPQVNVRWSALQQLAPKSAQKLIDASARIFYQDRTIDRVLALAPRGFELIDLKAIDARETLAAVLHATPLPKQPRSASSMVRRARLEAIGFREDDPALRDAGLRSALLVGQARELGLRATREELLRSGSEELALERLMLDHAARMISDGPSPLEAISEARLGRAARTGRGSGARPGSRSARHRRRGQ